MVTVALADEFLEALGRLPQAQQKKVREFTRKFRANPTAAAINYEKIHNVKDPRVRTVRIDQKYRAVVLHPQAGNVYVLVWVDNHDEAMDWARYRTFEVNPVTGALQVFNVQEIQAALPVAIVSGEQGLLAACLDETLLSFGVPAVLLPAVRAITTAAALQDLARHLPAEAAEALCWLAEGIPPEEVREAMVAPSRSDSPKARIDTQDLAQALAHPDSRRRFVTLQSDEELAAILDAPLAKWRIFLHPSQDRLVTKSFNGAAKVTGGPGTGKTVVAMHRARHLARTFCAAGEKVLFTTYTANLAQNIAENLDQLCGAEREQIEVVHLHAWAIRFLKRQGREFKILQGEELEQTWEAALKPFALPGFDTLFVRQEWEQVVQAHRLTTQDEYLKIPRLGRGRTLSRPQRAQLWQVFERFRELLRQRGQHEWSEIIWLARHELETKRPALPYRAVVIDEAQDFHAEEWKLLRTLVPVGINDLFLVGDAHQRIYGRKVALGACGVNVRGRSAQLKINYRTTEQIRAWAMATLAGLDIDDLDNETQQARGYKSLLSGVAPTLKVCATRAAEQAFLKERLQELLQNRAPEELCLVARTAKLLRDLYVPVLKQLGVTHTMLEKKEEGSGVKLATMHRVKGLEFPVMLLAGLNADVLPWPIVGLAADPLAWAEHEQSERALLFVAATRARDLLILSCHGTPCSFLPSLAG